MNDICREIKKNLIAEMRSRVKDEIEFLARHCDDITLDEFYFFSFYIRILLFEIESYNKICQKEQ